MNPWKSVKGIIQVELIGVNPLRELRKANEAGIAVSRLVVLDDLTISFEIYRNDYRKLYKLMKHRGCRLRVRRNMGSYWTLRRLLRRPFLLVGILGIFVLTLYLPTRVMFVQVTGNQSVPEKLILEAASECGIDFGASRRMIRSEKVKNSLLAQLPQLQWLGVNTYGCTAIISVVEKTQSDSKQAPLCISSIIASRDGVISGLTVSSGTPLCKIGQAVRAGQLLVSGYSDCGICIHGSKSDADIFADTQRNLETVTPNIYLQRLSNGDSFKNFSLIIGKKRINLYKGSGISDATCGKMYEDHFMTLPGGFQLPVTLRVETWVTTVAEPILLSETHTAEISDRFSQAYLKQKMVAGEIISGTYGITRVGDADCMHGRYMCREMIGQMRIEEIIDQYEENN